MQACSADQSLETLPSGHLQIRSSNWLSARMARGISYFSLHSCLCSCACYCSCYCSFSYPWSGFRVLAPILVVELVVLVLVCLPLPLPPTPPPSFSYFDSSSSPSSNWCSSCLLHRFRLLLFLLLLPRSSPMEPRHKQFQRLSYAITACACAMWGMMGKGGCGQRGRQTGWWLNKTTCSLRRIGH